MSQLNTSAYPALDKLSPKATKGLSKRQYVCIELRLPETDNDELDSLIDKARRIELARQLYIEDKSFNVTRCMEKANLFFDHISKGESP